ncbi:hypothetical protein C8R48DRAFT_297616 [Suillus tomentosus]|nr:hypothetical protein C8R48DRAFT_297616 [Suillus tomentosus]
MWVHGIAALTNHRHSTHLFRNHLSGSLVPYQREQVIPSTNFLKMIEPSLPGASSSVSHELGTQSFQKSLPEDDTCSEEQTLSGPSVRRHQRLYLPVVQDGEDKVKCMWSGCSSVIKKDSYTRHVSEVHKRRFKAVCTTCRKEFLRPYMKKTHICPRRFSKRGSS